MTVNIAIKSPSACLEEYVGRRINSLQKRFRGDDPSAAADLARLRRALHSAAGSDPAVWSVIFDGWPAKLAATSDEPTHAETAAHAAVCLYAIHQQGRRDADMHQRDWSLGRAVGWLAFRLGVDAESAVKRRFDAVVTADDYREILHHGRGLITQLRGEKIPLDYGLFAKHLYWLQSPLTGDHARLRWARDFYKRPNPPQLENPEGDRS